MATSASSSTMALPSATNAPGTTSNGPTSSPLLFFVALGFGVVFTNLWIIVGVKYCFRYNQRARLRTRAGQTTEDASGVDMLTMPRQRRRREKKLMSIEDVNTRFPMVKYKTWRDQRAAEGLPDKGGVVVKADTTTDVQEDGKLTIAAGNDEKTIDILGDARSPTSATDTVQSPDEDTSTRPANVPIAIDARNDKLDLDKELRVATIEPGTDALQVPDMKLHDDHDHDHDHDHSDVEDETMPAQHSKEFYATPGDTCAICIDTIEEDDDIRGLTCGHAFHAACVDPWLTSRRACCPLCKADYYTPKPPVPGQTIDNDTPQAPRSAQLSPLRYNASQTRFTERTRHDFWLSSRSHRPRRETPRTTERPAQPAMLQRLSTLARPFSRGHSRGQSREQQARSLEEGSGGTTRATQV